MDLADYMDANDYLEIKSLLNILNDNELKLLEHPTYSEQITFIYQKEKYKVTLSKSGNIKDISKYCNNKKHNIAILLTLYKTINKNIIELINICETKDSSPLINTELPNTCYIYFNKNRIKTKNFYRNIIKNNKWQL